MKFYTILLFCCIIYYVDCQYCSGARLKGILAHCSAEKGATPNDVDEFLSQKKSASESAKCFRACALLECKVMDVEGNLDPDNHKEYLQFLSGGDAHRLTLTKDAFQKCLKLKKVEGEICVTADNYMDCLFTNCKNCGWNLHNL